MAELLDADAVDARMQLVPGLHRADARRLFEQVALADDFPDFLTLPAYELID